MLPPEIERMRRVVCRVASVGLLVMATPLCAQAPAGRSAAAAGADLQRLTVPAALLPANCRPSAPGGMFSTNPSVVTDPRVLGLMHGLVFGVTPGDANQAGTGRQSQPGRPADDDLSARAADVVIGYAAAYEETGGSPEIGVFALLMKTPPLPQGRGASGSGTRFVKGSVAVFSWSDATPHAPDRGCVDVIRRHIESIEFR
jgi:hypothetical protein